MAILDSFPSEPWASTSCCASANNKSASFFGVMRLSVAIDVIDILLLLSQAFRVNTSKGLCALLLWTATLVPRTLGRLKTALLMNKSQATDKTPY